MSEGVSEGQPEPEPEMLAHLKKPLYAGIYSLDWSEINEKVKILEISKSSQHFETTLPL